jgi:hypothetical protein
VRSTTVIAADLASPTQSVRDLPRLPSYKHRTWCGYVSPPEQRHRPHALAPPQRSRPGLAQRSSGAVWLPSEHPSPTLPRPFLREPTCGCPFLLMFATLHEPLTRWPMTSAAVSMSCCTNFSLLDERSGRSAKKARRGIHHRLALLHSPAHRDVEVSATSRHTTAPTSGPSRRSTIL